MMLLGLLMATPPNRLGFVPTVTLLTMVGIGCGLICRVLTRNGSLPVYDVAGKS